MISVEGNKVANLMIDIVIDFVVILLSLRLTSHTLKPAKGSTSPAEWLPQHRVASPNQFHLHLLSNPLIISNVLFAETVSCNHCTKSQKCLPDLMTHQPKCVVCNYKCPRKRRPATVSFFLPSLAGLLLQVCRRRRENI